MIPQGNSICFLFPISSLQKCWKRKRILSRILNVYSKEWLLTVYCKDIFVIGETYLINGLQYLSLPKVYPLVISGKCCLLFFLLRSTIPWNTRTLSAILNVILKQQLSLIGKSMRSFKNKKKEYKILLAVEIWAAGAT